MRDVSRVAPANTGHAVEEEDPQLVIDVILDAVKEAR
jgi:hypothetical protein